MADVLLRRGEWHAAARLLHAQNPDMSNGQIARLIGVTPSAVWKVLHPEKVHQINVADNKARRAAKTAWEYEERRRNRAQCDNPVCGNLRGILTPRARRKPGFCAECRHAVAEVRRTLAEGMWADQWSLASMADAMGVKVAYFSTRRLNEGWDLPYRYKGTKRSGVTETSPFYTFREAA